MEEREGLPKYLLSDQIRIMTRVDLEAAVVGPQIDGDTYTGNSALVDL